MGEGHLLALGLALLRLEPRVLLRVRVRVRVRVMVRVRVRVRVRRAAHRGRDLVEGVVAEREAHEHDVLRDEQCLHDPPID